LISNLERLLDHKKLSFINGKLLPMLTVAFPGGYKFLVVMAITLFAGDVVANEFTKAFFWVGFLVTFSGLPIAALMVSNKYIITTEHKAYLVFFSLLITFLISYVIELKQFDIYMNIAIFMSVLVLSFYEIYKRYFLNYGNFLYIFISSIGTLFLFALSFILFTFSYDEISLILFCSFFSLLLPIIILFLMKGKSEKEKASSFSSVFKGFFQYLVSNAASTSLMFAVPILIIAELGDVVAADLAQIFYFSTLSYLIPRALSAKHIPNMRNKGIIRHEVNNFFKFIFIFVVIAISFALPLFYYFYEQWLIYILLFSAMQLSQLSLPFSNVLGVKGDVNTLLKINLFSTLVLMITAATIYYGFDKGLGRCESLLIAFCSYQFLKLYLGFNKSKKYFT